MIHKPDTATRNAVELHELLVRVIVLASIWEDDVVEAAGEWLRTAGTSPRVIDAAKELLKAAQEDE
jgi:hypothetical protein